MNQHQPSDDPHRSWDQFWAMNARHGGTGGCLPQAYARIDAAQRECWTALARRLDRNARVLDLATGDGRVMRWLLGARPDLKPVGVDMARQLPAPPRGARMRGGVRMERLPFPDGRFAAVTSQFGFEYGQLEKTASEAARVLRTGGLLALVTHRKDGPILAHNLARREQIRWAVEERALGELARQSLALPTLGARPLPPAIGQAPAQGARLFGEGSAAWEIAEALRRTLVMGASDTSANVAATIDAILAQAHNELGRIASLEAACETTANETAFAGQIEAAGFEAIEKRALCEAESITAFADFRLYRRC